MPNRLWKKAKKYWFDLNDLLTKMDEKGFSIFVGKENLTLTGGVTKSPEIFPILHIYILRKNVTTS